MVKRNNWNFWLDDLIKASKLRWSSDLNSILVSNKLANDVESEMFSNTDIPKW